MFGIDTLIGDAIGSFLGDSPTGSRGGQRYRGGKSRGKRFYDVGKMQARARKPVKSQSGFRKSPKDKYIMDAKEATKYAGRNYTL